MKTPVRGPEFPRYVNPICRAIRPVPCFPVVHTLGTQILVDCDANRTEHNPGGWARIDRANKTASVPGITQSLSLRLGRSITPRVAAVKDGLGAGKRRRLRFQLFPNGFRPFPNNQRVPKPDRLLPELVQHSQPSNRQCPIMASAGAWERQKHPPSFRHPQLAKTKVHTAACQIAEDGTPGPLLHARRPQAHMGAVGGVAKTYKGRSKGPN